MIYSYDKYDRSAVLASEMRKFAIRTEAVKSPEPNNASSAEYPGKRGRESSSS